MKIILPISQKTFSQFKTACITQAPDDYYSRVGNRSSSSYDQEEARFNNREAEFIQRVIAVKNEKFPFNLFKSVKNYTWNIAEHFPENTIDDVVNGMDWSIHTKWGYHIDNENQCYAYSTCAGNFHGVYKCRETGEYFSFMRGSRHALMVPHGEEDRNNTPVLYKTSAPKEMKFYERQCDFLCRMGGQYSAKYFAEHCPDIMFTEYQQYSTDCYTISEYETYYHMKKLNPSFDDLIFAEVFKNTSPETYLLNKYRNKKFQPELLTGKDLIAWNLIPQDVKARFVKYA